MLPQHRCIMVHNTRLQSLYMVQACSPPRHGHGFSPGHEFSPSPPVGMGGSLGHHLCLSVCLSAWMDGCMDVFVYVCMCVCMYV